MKLLLPGRDWEAENAPKAQTTETETASSKMQSRQSVSQSVSPKRRDSRGSLILRLENNVI